MRKIFVLKTIMKKLWEMFLNNFLLKMNQVQKKYIKFF